MADLSIPSQGMTRASADFDRAASKIARAPSSTAQTGFPQDTVELSTSTVDLLQAKSDVEANTRTFRISDEMNRTVLDMVG
jgi:flagellar basal body rod protein FlgC